MNKLQQTRNEVLPIPLVRIAIFLLTGILAFCAQPTFGQHGSSGSGQTGSGHASGSGHGGGTVALSSGTARSSGGSTYVSGQGATAITSSHGPSNVYAGPGLRPGSVSPNVGHFVGGNNTWVEPPGVKGTRGPVLTTPTMQTAGAMIRGGAQVSVDVHRLHAPMLGLLVPGSIHERNGLSAEGPFLETTMILRPPIMHKPRHFRNSKGFLIVGSCLDGFFPSSCGSTFLLGPAWGYGANCDPIADCDGDGYLDASPAGEYGMEIQSEPKSSEYGPFSWEDSPGLNAEEASPKPSVPVVIYLRDGTSYGVTDYWLTAGRLNYLTSYGGENAIPVEMLNLQKTVDENAARGMVFTLRNQRLGQEQR
jgi:hypothetical protein